MARKWKSYKWYLDLSRWSYLFFNHYGYIGASLIAQMVKRLPTMQETRVRSLGWEDPLEKEMATHSSILVWRIPWTEEIPVHGVSKSGTRLSDFTLWLCYLSDTPESMFSYLLPSPHYLLSFSIY